MGFFFLLYEPNLNSSDIM